MHDFKMEVDVIANFPSDDEEVDSDIESYLYSQLHYSTDLSLGPDSELVIEKEDTSDDEKLPEIIPIPREEPNTKGENLWAIHEKDLKGADAYRNAFGRNKRYYLDDGGIRPKCSNCRETGHTVTECPKVEVCYLCGLQGHSRWSCPNDICYNCSEIGHISKACSLPKNKYYAVCKRCWGRGHNRNSCPEIWRQYHLTAKDSSVIKKPSFDSSGILKTMRKIRYCFNCGEKGHFGHDCEKERPNRRPVNSPFTVYYDRCPFKSGKAEESIKGNLKRVTKGRETHEAKDLRKPEGHREDYLRISEGHRENNWGMSEDHRENNWGVSEDRRKDNWRISEFHREENWRRISEGHRENNWRTSEGHRENNWEISRDRREDLSRTQGEKAWEKYLRDQNKLEKKDRRNGEIERKSSTDKHSHRPAEEDLNRKHSDIQKRLKENAAEKEKGNSSQSTGNKARNEVVKRLSKNEEKKRSVEKPEKERSELKREVGSKTEDSNERRREKGVRNVDIRFTKGRHEVAKEHDRRAEAINEKKDSGTEFSSSGIEKTGKESNKVVIVKRDNTKKNSSATEQTQIQSRKRTWNSSLPETKGPASCDESPFKIIKSAEIVNLDESGNFEFIDLDIYADSDSSLEGIGKNYSGGYRDLPKEEDAEDEDTKMGREKKIKLDKYYSAGTLENLPNCSDASKKHRQASDNEKRSKSTKDSGNKSDNSRSLEKVRATQKPVAGDAAKMKTFDNFSSRQRKIGVDVTESNKKKTDKATPSKKVGNAEKMRANAQSDIVLDTKKKQCLLPDFEKHNSAQIDRSLKDMTDHQLKSRNVAREKPEGSKTVTSNKSENIELVENSLVAKRENSKSLSDSFPKSDKAATNQTWLPPSPENTDLALRFFFGKSEQKASNASLFAHESKILKNKGEAERLPSICEDSKNAASHETSMASSVPCSAPPYDARGLIVDKKWDGGTEEPPEVFVEDHVLWEDVSDYDSLSDPGEFQFSNMHFEPVSSSDDDLRVKIDSLKSKRSQELSSVVVDATPSGVEEYGNAALEDDVSNNGNLSSEIQVSSMENVDRRRIDMTRYDPSKCIEEDLSSYQSYENYADRKHPPLKRISEANKNALTYGKRRKGVTKLGKIPSQLDGVGSVRPNKSMIRRNQFMSPHSTAPTEADAWMERVALSREERAGSQVDRGSKGDRFVSMKKKNNVKERWKRGLSHAASNTIASNNSYSNELSGKAYRKMSKRNWRKTAQEKERPEYVKGFANFKNKGQMHMPIVEFDGANRDHRNAQRAVERKGLNLARRGRGGKMLRFGETRYSQATDANRTHRIQQKASKGKVKLNRGFRSSDIAKSFSFSAML